MADDVDRVSRPTFDGELSRPDQRISLKTALSNKAAEYCGRVPIVRKLPLPVLAIILAVAAVNVLVWAACGVVLIPLDSFLWREVLELTAGLSALSSPPQPFLTHWAFVMPLMQTTYHIVIITSIVVAATAAAVSDKFDRYSKVGGIIGTSVSAGFLIILGIMNIYILYKLLQQMKKLTATHPDEETPFKIQGAGCLFQLFREMFKLIDRPWKMYPLGVLFGLGFDTSSEIALLGIASIQAAKGTSFWVILIFPALFTAGMCLLDTTDGALMMTLYTATALGRDQLAILYYSSVLTAVTILAALIIGFIQLLSLVQNVAQPEGRFWDGVQVAGDHYDIIGGGICASFILFGGLSVVLYGPWRRRVERRRRQRQSEDRRGDGAEDVQDGGGAPVRNVGPENAAVVETVQGAGYSDQKGQEFENRQ